MTDKEYLRGTAKIHRFSNGGYVINFSVNSKELLELAKKQDEKSGEWCNLTMSPRKSTDKFGNTHSVYVNDFKPDKSKAKPKGEPEAAATTGADDNDDLPF